MSEEASLAEQLTVIGGNRDPRVVGDDVEEFLDDTVEITDGIDLPMSQQPELLAIEELLRLAGEAAADEFLVEVLEDAVDAADARPFVGRLVGQRERVVRLADVEQVERRLLLGEGHL